MKTTKYSAILIDFIFILILSYTFYEGMRAVKNVEFPFDGDLERNIAQSQSVIDGHPLSDPNYLGETIWYNPLIPALTAMGSKVTGSSVQYVNLRISAYINLLVPIIFYLFINYLYGRIAALSGTFAILFLIGNNLPTYFTGTYSPISYALHFAPVWFLLTFWCFIKASENLSIKWYVLTGLFLGLTFLTHTAPAVIAGMTIFSFVCVELYSTIKHNNKKESLRRNLIGFSFVFGTAFIVSIPFLYSILFHYKLDIKNYHPIDFTEKLLLLVNFDKFIRIASPGFLILSIVLAGLISFFLKKKDVKARFIIICSTILIFLMAYNYLRQAIKVVYLPQVVPGFHYFIYITYLIALFFGIGIAVIVGSFKKFILFLKTKLTSKSIFTVTASVLEAVAAVLILLVFFVIYKDDHENRQDFKMLKSAAYPARHLKDSAVLNDWLLAKTKPLDVILNDEKTPDQLVMSARKFVVNPGGASFSNPYVDYEKRLKDRDLLFLSLEKERYDVFSKLVNEYKISYIMTSASVFDSYWDSPVFLEKVFRCKNYELFRLNKTVLETVKSIASSGEPHPYKVLREGSVGGGVIVYDLRKRHFDPFEQEDLGGMLDTWRWIYEKNTGDIVEILSRLRREEAVTISRKKLMNLIDSSEISRLTRRDLLFCNFTAPAKAVRIQKKFPEKAIIFVSGRTLQKELFMLKANIYKLTGYKEMISSWSLKPDSFIQEACLMVFNSRMEERYASKWRERMESGKATREEMVISLLEQAKKIDY